MQYAEGKRLLARDGYAEALLLQAEYAPEPPFPGGTLATTPPAVGTMMREMFAPLEGQFRAIAMKETRSSS